MKTSKTGAGQTVYDVTRLGSIEGLGSLLAANAADTTATSFQTLDWLTAWYGEVAPARGCEPCILAVHERTGGGLAMVLPLVLRRSRGLRLVEAPDLGVTDYNGPILGPAAPIDTQSALRLWAAVLRALPPADLVQLTKVPVTIAGRANPLALLPVATPSAVFGNQVEITGTLDEFLRLRGRKFRKECGRYLRRLEARGQVRLKQATGREEALSLYAMLETKQSERMRGLGKTYALDQPCFASLYRRLLTEGLTRRFGALFCLMVNGRPVAFLFGVLSGQTFSLLRLTHVGGEWEDCSPGRIVVIETIRALADRGVRNFDMTIGDYAFKRSFDPVRYPLVELIAPLSPWGRASTWLKQVKRRARANSAVQRTFDRVLRRT